jgi:catechol 2,3-dioxygenase-like lactoylglutathione lyase family enzyme
MPGVNKVEAAAVSAASSQGGGKSGKILRCDHVHLITADIERTVDWYCRVLGATVTFEGRYKGSAVRYLQMGGMNFIVFGRLEGEPAPAAVSAGPRYGVDHFGFAVENLDQTLCELRAAGARVLEGPVDVRPGLRIAYIEAPDQARIELSERRT